MPFAIIQAIHTSIIVIQKKLKHVLCYNYDSASKASQRIMSNFLALSAPSLWGLLRAG